MLVRIRLKSSKNAAPGFPKVMQALAALLSPSAVIAFTIAGWAIAAEFRWTTGFFISTGLFSHWQVWLFAAAVLLLFARLLNRYA